MTQTLGNVSPEHTKIRTKLMDKESNNYKKLICYLKVLIHVFSNQISIHHCINIWDKCISGKVLLSINEEIRNIYFHLFTCMNFYINHGYPLFLSLLLFLSLSLTCWLWTWGPDTL